MIYSSAASTATVDRCIVNQPVVATVTVFTFSQLLCDTSDIGNVWRFAVDMTLLRCVLLNKEKTASSCVDSRGVSVAAIAPMCSCMSATEPVHTAL